MKQSTFDPELVSYILDNITVALERIERRAEGVVDAEDFLQNDTGIDRLDGIAMMLIAVGEQLKQLDSMADLHLAERFPDVDWKGAKGIRDSRVVF